MTTHRDEFMALASDANECDKAILAGIYRVEAGNDRSGHVKIHKPSLGPYSDENPKTCVDCGKTLDETLGEPCLPEKKS